MYERMLNKQEQPQYNEMCMHCKECGELFAGLNTWLMETFATHQDITFPYGNHYGWGIAHRTVMLRLSDTQFASVYEQLQPYAKEYVDNRYPCGNGGWIHYRVCEEAHMEDIQRLLFLRCD